jgi:hypothetical protein
MLNLGIVFQKSLIIWPLWVIINGNIILIKIEITFLLSCYYFHNDNIYTNMGHVVQMLCPIISILLVVKYGHIIWT